MSQRGSSLRVIAPITVAALAILLASCDREPTGFQPGTESLPTDTPAPSEPFPSPTVVPNFEPTPEATPEPTPAPTSEPSPVPTQTAVPTAVPTPTSISLSLVLANDQSSSSGPTATWTVGDPSRTSYYEVALGTSMGAADVLDWRNIGHETSHRVQDGLNGVSLNLDSNQARIHRWTGMDGVRTAEGGEGVTGAMIRARIWVDGRLAGGLQALLGAPMAAYSGCGERDGGIGHGKRRSRTGLARVCGDVGLAGGSVADGRRQAGSGMARSRARARLNCSSQGQRRGRCRVNRRAERVIRPAKAKTRRLRVLVVTIC